MEIQLFEELSILGLSVDTTAQHIRDQRQHIDVHVLTKRENLTLNSSLKPSHRLISRCEGRTKFIVATNALSVSRDRYAGESVMM